MSSLKKSNGGPRSSLEEVPNLRPLKDRSLKDRLAGALQCRQGGLKLYADQVEVLAQFDAAGARRERADVGISLAGLAILRAFQALRGRLMKKSNNGPRPSLEEMPDLMPLNERTLEERLAGALQCRQGGLEPLPGPSGRSRNSTRLMPPARNGCWALFGRPGRTSKPTKQKFL